MSIPVFPIFAPSVIALRWRMFPLTMTLACFRSFAASDWTAFDTPPKVIAVTGSNGKSTTNAYLSHLQRAGRESQLAGNIGRGVMDLDHAQNGEVVVLELSSYQTERRP